MMENTPASDFPLFALTGTLRIGSIQRNLYGFSREMSGRVAIRRKLSGWGISRALPNGGIQS